MASSTNLPSANDDASVNPGSSLLKAAFNPHPSQMELTSSSHLSNSSISSFANKILSEFDMHLPRNKFDQDLSAALWQQQPSAGSFLDAEKPQGFTFNSRMEANSFVSNIHDMKSMSELMNPPLAGGCWGPPGLGQDLAYSSSLTAIVHVSNGPLPSYLNRSTQRISEGFLVRELVGSNGHGKGVSTLASTSLITSTLPFGLGTEKTMNIGSDWSCVTGASISSLDVVDQSKARSASQYLTNFSPDPGFAERAARFSCFGGHGYSELAPALPRSEPVKTCPRSASRSAQETAMKKLTQVLSFRHSAPSSPSIDAATELQDSHEFVFDKVSGRFSPVVQTTEAQNHVSSAKDSGDMEVTLGQQEESSPSEIGECEMGIMGSAENARRKKRKFGSKDKCKDTYTVMAATISGDKDLKNGANLEETRAKRSKNQGAVKEDPDKMQVEQSNSANSGDSAPNSIKENAKPSEPPKQDFIHVRARRGQATDSHSLAERVRREKISERMKFLQELVPGCSKVTGKAVMLDEIINYVQSLQRQVEFLSMKLAAVNPRIDINLRNVNKETMQNRGGAASILFPADNNTVFPVHHQPQQMDLPIGGSFGLEVSGSGNPGDLNLGKTMNSSAAASIDAYEEALCQLSQSWGDDLQSIVQMAFGKGKAGPPTTQRLSGRLQPSTHTNFLEMVRDKTSSSTDQKLC